MDKITGRFADFRIVVESAGRLALDKRRNRSGIELIKAWLEKHPNHKDAEKIRKQLKGLKERH